MRDATRSALAVLALSLGVIGAVSPAPAAAQAVEQAGDQVGEQVETAVEQAVEPTGAAEPTSGIVTQMADWVIVSGDNHLLPFVIIDKVAAEIYVFGADGRLRGAGPALLGLAPGDDSVPGIGDRPVSDIRPDERTTPAGRFLAGFGPATGEQQVLWVDYATSISLHPVVTAYREEQREQRLQSPSPEDNRITYGCINVSAAFYEDVVRRTFTGTSGVVYILPETRPVDEVFPAFHVQARASADPTDDPTEGLGPERSEEPGVSETISAAGSDAAPDR
jgi:hypothetical protein